MPDYSLAMRTTSKGVVVVVASIAFVIFFRVFLIGVLAPVLVGLFIIAWSIGLGAGVYLIARGMRSRSSSLAV